MDHPTGRRLGIAALAGIEAITAAFSSAFAANDVLTPTSKLYVDWFGSAVSRAPQLSGQDRANALLIAGWVRPTAAPARVTLRCAMSASKASNRLRSTPVKFIQ